MLPAYRCKDCEHAFDEPEYICERERIDYGIGSRWVTLWEGEVCPKCESDDIEAVEPDEVTP